ncbi:ammonium transporter [Desulfobacter hydrogenophilus]|uniref:Ammonium transporter n=1 Tax=Desulfobacter hydrogenophilus TaxID=2291 RepID=A0A328FDA5_9BACT|nr:ammonium transporter [Desulfobacter hydrogenophilus]NDY72650.1 ammonium transporter [Desulfobacter hydrogenophilus]QBH14531.1 ammonium transporter [Desulfobacter hydrogenophilus]RAM01412.1 ammonium transporter [Desulfobacter hydrogenophilus]
MKYILMILTSLACTITAAWAGTDDAPTVLSNADAIKMVQTHANYVWTLVAAVLVFFMQAGFAMVEAGFTRAKNAINIMMKNLMDFSMGSLFYWAIGFGLMFGVSKTGFFGTTGFFLSDFEVGGDPWVLAFWMFQVVFAATAATIVSGAMAERTKFTGYLVYSAVLSALIYPIFGSWAWGSLFNGSGWLEGLGFIDFAGSTVVHSVGGWAALAGAIVLGPRLGKFTKDGGIKPILGHNIPLAALGVFILWVGWFGFNPGSTTTADTSIAMIFVNTNMAAATGCVMAMIVSWIKFGKPEVGMSLNGALAGLVGITAGCANVTPGSAIIIGAVAGILVVFSVMFFDKIRVDDPVGAVSVHGVCGAWGTLAAGIFNIGGTSIKIISVQCIGMASCFAWTFCTAFILFKVIDSTMGLRVSPEEEIEGLDSTEHGGNAYPDFSANH